MACFDDYIAIDRSLPSRTGLYATDLTGLDLLLFDSLTKDDQADYLVFYNRIYNRAWTNLVSDISKMLQDKFHVDYKLVSRETSVFVQDNITSGLAGIILGFNLPKYARLHVISVGVNSNEDYVSPDFQVLFYDEDESGELLHEVSLSVTEGRNTINVDSDFEVDKLFIAYDADLYVLKGTENKYYNGNTYWDKLACTFPCADGNYQGSVRQINGGGLNIKYNITCSIDKFVCDNINIFKTSLWWRIGLETAVERRFGNKVNQFTMMKIEDAENLQNFYNTQYQQELSNSIKSQNIYEDDVCFACKNTIYSKTYLP